MKLLHLYICTRAFSNLIPTKKICKDCKHFIAHNLECRKFGDTNIVTGKVTYHSARDARDDKTKCGEDAILFEENHFKIITTPYYFLKENLALLLPSGLLILYFLAAFYTLHK